MRRSPRTLLRTTTNANFDWVFVKKSPHFYIRDRKSWQDRMELSPKIVWPFKGHLCLNVAINNIFSSSISKLIFHIYRFVTSVFIWPMTIHPFADHIFLSWLPIPLTFSGSFLPRGHTRCCKFCHCSHRPGHSLRDSTRRIHCVWKSLYKFVGNLGLCLIAKSWKSSMVVLYFC